MALGRYEAGICDCGFHSSLTSDTSNYFTFENRVCNICAAAAKQARVQIEADDRATKALGDKPPPLSPRPADGRRTLIRQMTPAEVEERRARRSGVGPHQSAGDLRKGNQPHKRRQGEQPTT